MKNYWIKIFIVAMICATLSGCGGDLPFITGTTITVDSEEVEIYTYTQDNITYEVEKGVLSRTEMEDWVNEISEKLQEIEDYLPPKKKSEFTVRVLTSTPVGGMYIEEDVLYVRASDLSKERYLPWLVQLHYGLDQTWAAFGICENVYENPDYETDLKEYFSQNEDLGVLAFCPARFITYLNYESDYIIATQAAKQLVAYCIENGKSDRLLGGEISATDKQEWIDSLGLELTYDEAGEELFGNVLSISSYENALYVELKNVSYEFHSMDYMETAVMMEQYMVELERGSREAEKLLQEYAGVTVTTPKMNLIVDDSYEEEQVKWDDEAEQYNIVRIVPTYPAMIGMRLTTWMAECDVEPWKLDEFSAYWPEFGMDGMEMGIEGYGKTAMEKWSENPSSLDPFTFIWVNYMRIDTEYYSKDRVDGRLVADLDALRGNGYTIMEAYRTTQNPSKASPMEQRYTKEMDSIMAYISEHYGDEVVLQYLIGGQDLYSLTGKGEGEILAEWFTYIDEKKALWGLE